MSATVGYTFPSGERLTPRYSEITSGPQQRIYDWPLWLLIPLPLFGPQAGSGLGDDGGVLTLIPGGAGDYYPTSPDDLSPGDLWNNGLTIAVYPGTNPNPNAPPVFFGQISAIDLLIMGGGNLPFSPGNLGPNQLWNNGGDTSDGGIISIALPGSGLDSNGGVLILADGATWPLGTSVPGGFYSNGGICSVAPGGTPNPLATPVFFGEITAQQLLALGGDWLPTFDPGIGEQLYNMSGQVTISPSLIEDGGFVVLGGGSGYPTASGVPGAVWDNGGLVSIVPGVTPDPLAFPIYLASTTAAQLLALGGGNLPLVEPTPGSGQLWNNNGFLSVA